jgi:biotin synthase
MKSAQLGRSLSRFACSGIQQRSYSVVHDVPQPAGSRTESPIPAPPQRTSSLLEQAGNATAPRSNWTKDEITEIHQTPLMELAFAAVRAHQDSLQSSLGSLSRLKTQPILNTDAI